MVIHRDISIQIAEDDRNIANLLVKYFQRDGFATVVTETGPDAIYRFDKSRPDLVILDVMLPGATGWQICDHIRARSDTPILMLTARSQEEDRIRGFTQGVDDYVTKPFSPREVVERTKAILRRTKPATRPALLQRGNLTLNLEKYTVTRDHEAINLTHSEFQLLNLLMSRPGRVYTRDEMLSYLHGDADDVIDRLIDVHIRNLRQKIEPSDSSPQFIMTRRGVGYYFNEAIR